MQTISIPTNKFVTRDIVVENVEFISPVGLNHLPCSGGDHEHAIGSERPIAIVWAEGRGWRLCRRCSAHLTKHAPDVVESASSVSISIASEISASEADSSTATTQVM